MAAALVLAGSASADPPANDDFAAATLLAGAEVSVVGSNAEATAEPGEPEHYAYQTGASVWYRWTAPADGTLVLQLTGELVPHAVAAVYTGTELDALALVAREAGIGNPFEIRFRGSAGTEYKIAIDGSAPYKGGFELSLQLYEPPANDDFATAVELPGASGTLAGSNWGATSESGEPPPNGEDGGASVWYRWTAPKTETVRMDVYNEGFNSILAVYTGSGVDALTPIAANRYWYTWLHSKVTFEALEGTEYRIAVDGWFGDLGSFTLRWKPAGPANDDFLDAEIIAEPSAARVVFNEWATKEPDEPLHAGEAGGASVWYRFDPPAYGTLTVDTDGSEIDTVLAVYEGNVLNPSLTTLTERDSDDTVDGRASVTLDVDGTRLWIAVDGVGGATGALDFNLVFHPHNDYFAASDVVDSAFAVCEGSFVGATAEVGEPAHAGAPAAHSVWCRWTAPATGIAHWRAWRASGARFAAYEGSNIGNLTSLRSATDADSDGLIDLRFDAQEGVTYALALDGNATPDPPPFWNVEMLPAEPSPRIASGSRLGRKVVPVTLAWQGPVGSGIERFDLQQLVGADWLDVDSVATTRTTRTLEPASGYQFRVRAAAGGEESGWIPGDEFALRTFQESNRKIVYRGPWTQAAPASAFGGGTRYTRQRGASARIGTTASALAIVSSKGPRRGKAAVLIDGARVRTIDLYAASVQPRAIVFARNWTAPGRHSVELRALGKKNALASGRRVDLDAFVALN